MNKIIQENIDSINHICKEMNVKELFAFGSVCNSNFTDKSDIDLLVTFNHMSYEDYADSFFDLADKLELILGRKVDLLTTKSLSNPYFIESLNKSKVLLYG